MNPDPIHPNFDTTSHEVLILSGAILDAFETATAFVDAAGQNKSSDKAGALWESLQSKITDAESCFTFTYTGGAHGSNLKPFFRACALYYMQREPLMLLELPYSNAHEAAWAYVGAVESQWDKRRRLPLTDHLTLQCIAALAEIETAAFARALAAVENDAETLEDLEKKFGVNANTHLELEFLPYLGPPVGVFPIDPNKFPSGDDCKKTSALMMRAIDLVSSMSYLAHKCASQMKGATDLDAIAGRIREAEKDPEHPNHLQQLADVIQAIFRLKAEAVKPDIDHALLAFSALPLQKVKCGDTPYTNAHGAAIGIARDAVGQLASDVAKFQKHQADCLAEVIGNRSLFLDRYGPGFDFPKLRLAVQEEGARMQMMGGAAAAGSNPSCDASVAGERGEFTIQKILEETGFTDSRTLNKYVKLAGVTPTGRGERNRRFTATERNKILRAIIENCSEADPRTRASDALRSDIK